MNLAEAPITRKWTPEVLQDIFSRRVSAALMLTCTRAFSALDVIIQLLVPARAHDRIMPLQYLCFTCAQTQIPQLQPKPTKQDERGDPMDALSS